MRQAIGIAVFFGMLGVTAFGLVLTPVFYVVIQKFVEARQNKKSSVTTNLIPAGSREA
jgi:multidrug efflux pump